MEEKIKLTPYDKVIKYFLPIIPKKLKPNHVTFFRLLMSPFLIVLFLTDQYETALIWFIVLAFTDMLDGAMARLRNQITDWGKIWDPIADKILIGIVVVMLLLDVNIGLTILLLGFEATFILGGAFMKITTHGEANVQANLWGKLKMGLQCIGAGMLILAVIFNWPLVTFSAQLVLYASILFAAMSMSKNGI